jgi:hypothetical protein
MLKLVAKSITTTAPNAFTPDWPVFSFGIAANPERAKDAFAFCATILVAGPGNVTEPATASVSLVMTLIWFEPEPKTIVASRDGESAINVGLDPTEMVEADKASSLALRICTSPEGAALPP